MSSHLLLPSRGLWAIAPATFANCHLKRFNRETRDLREREAAHTEWRALPITLPICGNPYHYKKKSFICGKILRRTAHSPQENKEGPESESRMRFFAYFALLSVNFTPSREDF
jgi:hypothetical protein